jgi:hypothetical protein
MENNKLKSPFRRGVGGISRIIKINLIKIKKYAIY